MAKKIHKSEAEGGPAAPESTGKAPVESAEINRPVKHEVANRRTITLANGEKRVYSPATHGSVWEALANNYHEANKGSTIE